MSFLSIFAVFSHFRCFNLVPAQIPMFVLGVPIKPTTEVSQQKFVQKHSYQHTFSWFPSVLDKSGDAELNGTVTIDLMLIQQNKFYWIRDRSMVAHLNYTDTEVVTRWTRHKSEKRRQWTRHLWRVHRVTSSLAPHHSVAPCVYKLREPQKIQAW